MDYGFPRYSPGRFVVERAFLSAALYGLKALLGQDDDWQFIEEKGYVKQNVAGGRLTSTLRAIVPN